MTPDPNFPNRPEGPEFERLARICREQDELVGPEVGPEDKDMAFVNHVTEIIPILTLMYVATNRALMVLSSEEAVDPVGSLAAAWVDAFMAGARYRQETVEVSIPLARSIVLADEEITACRAFGTDEQSETMIHAAGVVELHEDCEACGGMHDLLMQAMGGPVDG